MIAIAVDDESWALKTLGKAVAASDEITEVNSFSSCAATIEWAQSNNFDIAFLDVNMRGMGGIELAKKLREINENCFIIFCTGYQEYAIEAFRLHADGYLLKPVSADNVQEELTHLLKKHSSKATVTFRCFGGFEALDSQGNPISFKRGKTKELLALLVDRQGMGITSKEICAYMWEDDSTDDKKNLQYLWNLFSDLTKALRSADAEEILVRTNSSYAIDVEKVDCDYYDYLKGINRTYDPESYLPQYSWAEPTIASLINI